MSDLFDLPVHPYAARFPLMTDAALDELAADIRVKGLIQPIMLDRAGKYLVDGRNRFLACRRAKVEPRYDRLDGGLDPVDYIVSLNLGRRDLSAGQKAMLYAIAKPKREQGKRTDLLNDTTSPGVDRADISRARTVLNEAPDLVDQVIAGSSLKDAYTEAQRRRAAASSAEAQMAQLRESAPDLAQLVADATMTLSEATAALNQRRDDERKMIEAGRRAAASLVDFCSYAVTIRGAAQLGERGLVTAEMIARLVDAVELLRRVFEEERRS